MNPLGLLPQHYQFDIYVLWDVLEKITFVSSYIGTSFVSWTYVININDIINKGDLYYEPQPSGSIHISVPSRVLKHTAPNDHHNISN